VGRNLPIRAREVHQSLKLPTWAREVHYKQRHTQNLNKAPRERHDSFKERVKSLDHDRNESGQGEGSQYSSSH
jgi:hypothetical protein